MRELMENREDVEGRGASKEALGEPMSMAAVISGSSLFVRLNIRPMRLAADLAVGLRLRDLIEPGMVRLLNDTVGCISVKNKQQGCYK